MASPRYVIAVHGGAGPPRAEGHDALRASLVVATDILAGGGQALDAVVAAVRVLEDADTLNAGRGAALRADGTVELDAAVADGRSRRAGAVAALRTVRHPIDAARAVLVDGRHVLLAGDGAEAFAHAHGGEAVDNEWFVTERQRRALAADEHGTVGAVARDTEGNVAAATSTGGRRGQLPGRVGDSPVIGAGTWADNRTAAISATGHGEAFQHAVFAHDVHMRMLVTGATLDEACAAALEVVRAHGGTGGCIAVTAEGDLAMPFTTPAMLRGWASDVSGPSVSP